MAEIPQRSDLVSSISALISLGSLGLGLNAGCYRRVKTVGALACVHLVEWLQPIPCDWLGWGLEFPQGSEPFMTFLSPLGHWIEVLNNIGWSCLFWTLQQLNWVAFSVVGDRKKSPSLSWLMHHSIAYTTCKSNLLTATTLLEREQPTFNL